MMRSALKTTTRMGSVALAALALSLSMVTLSGCGSGARPGSAATRQKNGEIAFTIKWPEPSRLIPRRANSIQIRLFRGASEIATPVVINKPADFAVGQALVSKAAFSGLDVGGPTTPIEYRVVATAFPTTGAGGVAQAAGQTAASSILLSTTTPSARVPLTMDSTITRIEVAPNNLPSLLVTRSKVLTATCFDASNNVVLVDDSSIRWELFGVAVGSLSATTGNSVTFTGNNAGLAQVSAVVTEPVPNRRSATANINVVLTAVADSAFPKFHADQQNTGQVGINVTGNATTGARRWDFQASDSVVFSSPAVGKIDPDTGRFLVYVGAYDGRVYAINGQTGVTEWTTPPTGGPIDSSPALSEDGSLYVGSQDGKMYCFDSEDGSQVWTAPFDTGGSIVSSPNIGNDGGLYFGTTGATSHVFRLSAADGTETWRFTGAGGGIEDSPALSPDGQSVYFGAKDGSVYALNTTGGTLKAGWPVATGDAIINSSPAVDRNGNIYIGSLDGKVYARRPNGTALWTFDAGSPVYATPAIASNGAGTPTAILVGTFDNNTATDASKLVAINPTSGVQLWAYPGATDPAIGAISSSAAIGKDGTAYVGSYDGNVYAIRSNGARAWMFTVGDILESSPSIGADGTVFIGSYSGSVSAIR
jgi:outer membrane protein assembly factor BamB